MLGASALGRPRGMVWGGRREEGSGWGTHVYLWRIHFDIWQNEYNFVKFKNKKKKKKKRTSSWLVLKCQFNQEPFFNQKEILVRCAYPGMADPAMRHDNKPTLLPSWVSLFFWLTFQPPVCIPAELW